MRIVSLVPAATEIVAALGAANRLVGVSHECDWPPDVVRALPRVTRTQLDSSLPSAEIDRRMAAAKHEGVAPVTIDRDALARLAPEAVTWGPAQVTAR
jgi:iron complex transport system substrate-binding protein